MRWLLLSLMVFVFELSLVSQTPIDTEVKPGDKTPNFSDVSGSPYLFKDWSDGLVKFSSGRTLKQFKLKFDCVQNQLILQFEGSSFAAESKVKEFIMIPKNGKKSDSLYFRKGFPPVGKATNETFYQILAEGKATLLHLVSKNIIEEKQYGATNVYRHFENEERFFVFLNNEMIQVDRDRMSLTNILLDKGAEIKQFINDQDLRMRSPEDLTLVVKKYNALVQ
ncbi:MAG TPA: hypothetical protein VM012_11895 [Flavitalea sp.]|nr:hypothetical protein [Flavitalea sp.]